MKAFGLQQLNRFLKLLKRDGTFADGHHLLENASIFVGVTFAPRPAAAVELNR
jgi:hypothetical protein